MRTRLIAALLLLKFFCPEPGTNYINRQLKTDSLFINAAKSAFLPVDKNGKEISLRGMERCPGLAFA